MGNGEETKRKKEKRREIFKKCRERKEIEEK